MKRIIIAMLVAILATSITSCLALAGEQYSGFSASGKVAGLTYRVSTTWASPNEPREMVDTPVRWQYLNIKLEGKGAKKAITFLFESLSVGRATLSKDGLTYSVGIAYVYEVMVPATPCPMSHSEAARALANILEAIEAMRANELASK
jgi:hypothetical protein